MQIIFWLATSTVAALGYMNARKTIFQPLRTEIFKKQIEALSSALELFVGKGEEELAEDFDMRFGVRANIYQMYDAYLKYAFKRKRPDDKLEYRPELCPSAWVHEDYLKLDLEDKVEATEESGTRKKKTSEEGKPWEFRAGMIAVPRKYGEREAEFRAVLDNPVLPVVVADLIEQYLETVRSYLGAVGPVLEECSIEMPDRYPTLEDILRARFGWIDNRLAEYRCNNGISLSDSATAVVHEIRTYFDSDNLLPRGKSRKRK
ncbi:hypothetical protein [Streptomyces pactum]|uniref:hypothetical protein n=1 Tax=Streptomyces pactum TaxID=68249 RepID=UPI0036F4E582